MITRIQEGIGSTKELKEVPLPEKKDNPLHDGVNEILSAKRSAIEAHDDLRQSEGFQAATKRTRRLVGDYALGLHTISLMSTRHPDFQSSRLSIRIQDLLLESAISTWGHIENGVLNPARREMRFLLEASVKSWWCDQFSPTEATAEKVEFLNDLGKSKFREVADSITPRLLEESVADQLTQKLTSLYGGLSTNVHASTGGIRPDLHRFENGQYIGFERIADLNSANETFATVLDISLCSAFESFDEGLVGDIFVTVLDDQPKWSFHRLPLVRSVSSHFNYKLERQSGSSLDGG